MHWSDNDSFVKQSQEEMAALVDKLNKIGLFEPNLDTESAIQCAIQETKVSAFTVKRNNFEFIELYLRARGVFVSIDFLFECFEFSGSE